MFWAGGGDRLFFSLISLMDSPPILTIVNSQFLECTVHSFKYHCLLKLRSNICTATNDGETPMTTTSWAKWTTKTKRNGRTSMMAVPDISSLAAIPILSNAERTNSKRRRLSTSTEYDDDDDDEISRIHLLPKLFNSSRRPKNDTKSATTGESTFDDKFIGGGSRDDNHPIRELVRIAADLEVQLRERLGDALKSTPSVRQLCGLFGPFSRPAIMWTLFYI